MSKTITGNWVYPNNSAVANGLLVLGLSQDAVVAANTSIIAPANVTVTLNSSGSIPAATTIWANDELSPAGTTYQIVVSSGQGGGRVFGPETVSIAGASPINLNLLTPTSGQAIAFANFPVLQNPGVPQTVTGQPLVMASTTPFVANDGVTVVNGITVDSITATGVISTAGNLTAANVTTGGTVSAAGNLTAAVITGSNINTAGTISATGKITSAAQVGAATLSASGNAVVAGTATINGVAVHGVAVAGNQLVANSATDATWQSVSSGGTGFKFYSPAATTPVTVSNTTNTTALLAVTMTANSMALGSTARFLGQGVAGASGPGAGFTLAVFANATQIGSFSGSFNTANIQPWAAEAWFTCRASGSSGSVTGAVMAWISTASLGGTAWAGNASGVGSFGQSVAFNTTIAQTVTFQVTWATASTSNTITENVFTGYQIG